MAKTNKNSQAQTGTKKGEPISLTIEEDDMKVYQYLKNQLEIKKNQLKSMEMPLDKERMNNDARYMQEMILKNNVWQLEDQINAIEMMLGLK